MLMDHLSQQKQHPNSVRVEQNIEKTIINSSSTTTTTSSCHTPNLFTIGEYIIGETIGKGTFGKVKLGIHQPTQEKVAIKILEKSMILTESDAISIRSEIQILSQLRHPNISQLLEVIETDSCIFLILEFASNGELFHYITSRGKLSEMESCIIFAQALSALEYMQTQNICHRDLKPENILFDSHFQLKIIDFGLGKISTEGSDQQLHTCCGSPCYASPETLSSQPYVGKYVDLWSLGVILHAMLCGYLPFDDETPNGLFVKIKKCEFTMPDSISKEAAVVVSGLLKKEPTQRMTIAEIKSSEFYKKHISGISGNNLTQSCNSITQIGAAATTATVLDRIIIQQMIAGGLTSEEQLLHDLRLNNRTKATVIFYLLKNKLSLNRQIRMEDQSQSQHLSLDNSCKILQSYQYSSLPQQIQSKQEPSQKLQILQKQQSQHGQVNIPKNNLQQSVSPSKQIKFQQHSPQPMPITSPKQTAISPSFISLLSKKPSSSNQNIKQKKKNASVMIFKDSTEETIKLPIPPPNHSNSSRIQSSTVKQTHSVFHQDPLKFVSELKQNSSRIHPFLLTSPLNDRTSSLSQQLTHIKLSAPTPLASNRVVGEHRSCKSNIDVALISSPRFKTENKNNSTKQDNSNYQAIFSNFLKSNYNQVKRPSKDSQNAIPEHRQTKSQAIQGYKQTNNPVKNISSQEIKNKKSKDKFPSRSIFEMYQSANKHEINQKQSQFFFSVSDEAQNTNKENNKSNKTVSLSQIPQLSSDCNSGCQTTASNLGNIPEPISPAVSQHISNSVSFTNFDRLSFPSPIINLPSDKHHQRNDNNPKKSNQNLTCQTNSTRSEFIPEKCESPKNIITNNSKKTSKSKQKQYFTNLFLSQGISSLLKTKTDTQTQGTFREVSQSQNDPLKHNISSSILQNQQQQFLSPQKSTDQKVSQKIVKPSKDLLQFLQKLKDVQQLSPNVLEKNIGTTSRQPPRSYQDHQSPCLEGNLINMIPKQHGTPCISTEKQVKYSIERPHSIEIPKNTKKQLMNGLQQHSYDLQKDIQQNPLKQQYSLSHTFVKTIGSAETTAGDNYSTIQTTTATTYSNNNYQGSSLISEREKNPMTEQKIINIHHPRLKSEIIPQKNKQSCDSNRNNTLMKQEKTLQALLQSLKTASTKKTKTPKGTKEIDNTTTIMGTKLKNKHCSQLSCTFLSPRLIEEQSNYLKY